MNNSDPALTPHVEQAVKAVEKLHTEHHESASRIDHFLELAKERASQPKFLIAFTGMIAIWVLANLLLRTTGRAWDPPPFAYLQLALSAFAAVVTVLILATQRRADTLAGHREQMILQLAMVTEQKTAKMIALLEELRRDSPQVSNRVDPEAQQMARAADPLAVSHALRDADAEKPDANARLQMESPAAERS